MCKNLDHLTTAVYSTGEVSGFPYLVPVLVRVLLLLRDSMPMATPIKGNMSLGLAYSSKVLVHCCHGRKIVNVQAK